jgi:hypothetical protein
VDPSRKHNGKILKYIYINSSEKIVAQKERRTLEITEAEKDK